MFFFVFRALTKKAIVPFLLCQAFNKNVFNKNAVPTVQPQLCEPDWSKQSSRGGFAWPEKHAAFGGFDTHWTNLVVSKFVEWARNVGSQLIGNLGDYL